MTSNGGKWIIPSAMSSAISYSSNGMTVSGLSSGQSMYLSTSYNTPVIAEFDYVNGSASANTVASPQLLLDGSVHNENSISIRPNGNTLNIIDNSGTATSYPVTSVVGHYKIEFTSSTSYKIYKDDTLVATVSNVSISSTNMMLLSASNRSFTIKNVKIKPL